MEFYDEKRHYLKPSVAITINTKTRRSKQTKQERFRDKRRNMQKIVVG
jgi:hypothetical protein